MRLMLCVQAVIGWRSVASVYLIVLLGLSLGWQTGYAQPAVSPQIYLLGEVHDNPAIHEARYAFLRDRLKAGWRPAIVMEQFDRQRQEALTQAWQTCPDAPCVIQKAGGQGWDWPLYQPIIELALTYRLPLIAGNVSRQDVSSVMRAGYDALFSQSEQRQLGLDIVKPESMTARQVTAILEGHCGVLPQEMAMPMVQAQRARDAWLAYLVQRYAQQGVVVIAGNGHVDRQVGINQWLPQTLLPHVTVVGFIEADAIDFNAYDEMVVLPTFNRPDPCVAFKKMMQQKGPVKP